MENKLLCNIMLTPTFICRFVKGAGMFVARSESNGDFHYTSPKTDVFGDRGTSNMSVGCNIPALIN